MSYIFIDESGQFVKRNDEKYFVISSFIIGNPRRTEKRFRSWRRLKFPRKMRYQTEIKFSEVKIDDSLRLRTLKYIANLDVRVHFVYLERKNIPVEYWKKDKLQSGLLYTNIIGEMLDLYLPINDFEMRIFCDKRHLKGIKRSQFKEILKARLLPKLSKNSVVEIEMIDSTSNANIQIIDWICGSLAHYLEDKKLGKKYYQILKNNLLFSDGLELFKGYWDKKFGNKKLNRKD